MNLIDRLERLERHVGLELVHSEEEEEPRPLRSEEIRVIEHAAIGRYRETMRNAVIQMKGVAESNQRSTDHEAVDRATERIVAYDNVLGRL